MAFDNKNSANLPSIPEYYNGKTIFITGGTGFMGKVLIEKLLYSCPGVAKIHLLLRTKKGVRPEDRIKDLYLSECFSRLRNEKPDIFFSKISIVPGDVMELGLGMSEEHRQLLINSVDIIFHVAASVRFDDPMTYAVKMNLRGTREVVDLAKEIKNLSSFLHVSTAYSNTNQDPVDEVMYPPHADWRALLRVCDEGPENTIRILTPKLLGDIPNTYSFTKQLAEHVVYENKGALPAVIFRPSIVISSISEPMPGWVENFNGPVGILVASGKGILRSMYSDPDMKADYMPVDVAIRALITAAWARGTRKLEPSDDITIMNCCSGPLVNVTAEEVTRLGWEVVEQTPLDGMLWAPGGSITKNKTAHYIKVLFLHLLPAIFVDLILWVLGKKPLLVKIQRRIFIATLALQFYVTKQWTFLNSNLISLRSSLKEQDKSSFYYEIENVDPMEYFVNACKGAKKYLLKEKDEDLPKARAHYQRLQILDFVVQIIFHGLVFWWILHLSFMQSFIHKVLALMQM